MVEVGVLRRIVGMVGLAALLLSCGDDAPSEPANVLSARVVVDNPSEVYLHTDACSELSELSESNSAVHVTVSDTGSNADCLGIVTINLDQPLGTRRVIDDRTGSAIDVFVDHDTTPGSMPSPAPDSN